MPQVILYNESKDTMANAAVEADTFALIQRADGVFEPLTYNEWEALRCKQACASAIAKLADSDLDEAHRAQLAGYLDEFSSVMQQKYLDGNRSWNQLFELLSRDFQQLA